MGRLIGSRNKMVTGGKKKENRLPTGHHYFNYRERVEKELDELSKQTGITDWQSEYGQLVLADLQNRNLRDGTHRVQQAE